MRSAVLWFATGEFVDSSDRIEQRLNESVGGAALADWLASSLRPHVDRVVAPWAEDHGWDFDVTVSGVRYLVVCTIEDDEPREACVQIHLTGSGHGSLEPSDPLVGLVMACLSATGHSCRLE